jgi:hypothetical protein
VKKNGRISEGRLVLRLILKTGLLRGFSFLPIGLGLLRTGRLPFFSEKVHKPDEIGELIRAAEDEE